MYNTGKRLYNPEELDPCLAAEGETDPTAEPINEPITAKPLLKDESINPSPKLKDKPKSSHSINITLENHNFIVTEKRIDFVLPSLNRTFEYEVGTVAPIINKPLTKVAGETKTPYSSVIKPKSKSSHSVNSTVLEVDPKWIVLQRRNGSPEVPFWNASFEEYSNGFGNLSGDFWLGLEKVYSYVADGHSLQLRIELRGDTCTSKIKCSGLSDDELLWGEWAFSLGSKSEKYKLKNVKYLGGNLHNSTSKVMDVFTELGNNNPFVAIDSPIPKDSNSAKENLAAHRFKGAWWQSSYSLTALNGKYGSKSNLAEGMFYYWSSNKGSFNVKPKSSLILFRVKT